MNINSRMKHPYLRYDIIGSILAFELIITHLVLGIKLNLEDLGPIDPAPRALANDFSGEYKVLW